MNSFKFTGDGGSYQHSGWKRRKIGLNSKGIQPPLQRFVAYSLIINIIRRQDLTTFTGGPLTSRPRTPCLRQVIQVYEPQGICSTPKHSSMLKVLHNDRADIIYKQMMPLKNLAPKPPPTGMVAPRGFSSEQVLRCPTYNLLFVSWLSNGGSVHKILVRSCL